MSRYTPKRAGYTLIELIVAVGLFALVMTLVSGAYYIVISLVQRDQNMASGIDNLSFALETMTRGIRTGTGYKCNGVGDCAYPNGGSSLSITDAFGIPITYSLSGNGIQEVKNGVTSALTDSPIPVNVSSLMFYVNGSKPYSDPSQDTNQPYVTIIVTGTVQSGAGKPSQSFTVETSAAMRGSDL